jgi:hypothetical protein
MLKLNLVSKELKKEIKLRLIYEMLKKISGVLIVVTILCAVIILVAKIILQNNFNKVVEETTLLTKNSQQKNIKVREINSKISYINNMQDDFIPWSFLFEELSLFSEEGVKISSLKINKENKIINLRGVAEERDDLIKLKEGFESSDMFLEVESPIKNILEKTNIDFEINAIVDVIKIQRMLAL